LINYRQREKMLFGLQTEGVVPPNHITYVPEKVEIKHAKHWKTLKKPTDIELTELEEVSDSFFVTPTKGTVSGSTSIKVERVKEDVIPLHKLGANNPMVFYHEGCFFEDELNDNGHAVYEYKFRHMKDCWFGLVRCYLRVDEVCVYILDTRVYWEESFGKRIARQFMVKHGSW
jgi:type 2A phosphatase activator TIP41